LLKHRVSHDSRISSLGLACPEACLSRVVGYAFILVIDEYPPFRLNP